jgi:hypothetical protein
VPTVASILTRATPVTSRSSSVQVRPKSRRPPTPHHQLFRLLDSTADKLPGDGLRLLGPKAFFVVVDFRRPSFYDSLWACFMTPNIRLSTTNQNVHKIMHQFLSFFFGAIVRHNQCSVTNNKQLGKGGSRSALSFAGQQSILLNSSNKHHSMMIKEVSRRLPVPKRGGSWINGTIARRIIINMCYRPMYARPQTQLFKLETARAYILAGSSHVVH